jgi:hypothetical protein
MRKSLLFVAAILTWGFSAFAQEDPSLSPYTSWGDQHIANVNVTSYQLSVPSAAEIEAMKNPEKQGRFEKSGTIIPVNLNLQNSGMMQVLPGGDRLWRIRIHAPGALALNPYFENFEIPEGARLHVYNEDKSDLLGAFTSANNHESGIFATWYVKGDVMILEYFEPLAVAGQGHFDLTGVSFFFRNIVWETETRASDPCEVDVNCSEGTGWNGQRDGVVRLLTKVGSSTGFCSGSIINNTQQDCTPYILTAFHCGYDAGTNSMSSTADYNAYVFRFNYQKASCGSGVAGGVNQTGCVIRSWSNDQGGDTGSDFMLVELNANIASNILPFFNGWDANNTAPSGGVGIHHPAGDVKKISTFTATATSTKWGASAPNGTHWRFPWVATTNGWGVTEGGSSGSPIFRGSNRLIVGTLTGGASCCTSNGCGTGTGPSAQDYYGKMSYHWTSNGSTANRQLKPWLDPTNTGVLTLDGAYAPCSAGSEEISIDNLVNVYPNPSNGVVNIQISELTTETLHYAVYNQFGQLVLNGSVASGNMNYSIDLSAMAKGIYFVDFTMGVKKASKKVVLQ